MINFMKTNTNNQILEKLIFETCLNFGRTPQINNSKIHHYIFGIRQKINIFKLQEIRYLLLKVYPVIHNLFLQERLNFKQKKKWFFPKNYNFQTKTFIHPFRNAQGLKNLNQKYSNYFRKKTIKYLPPKILFATTTELYSEIVSSAAKKCHMPFHVKRWLSGSVTAASSYITDQKKWSFFINSRQEKMIDHAFQKRFDKYKKNYEQQKNKIKKYQFGRKPTLIIVPDVSNNDMILRETNSFGIPALGLVNLQNQTEVSYPIFVNDFSLYNVHFFCNFLSALILKEFVKSKQKISTSINKTKKGQFQENMDRLNNFLKQKKKNQRNFSLKKKNRAQNKPVEAQKHIFKGSYFLENFIKPKSKIRRKHYFATLESLKETEETVAKVDQENLVWLENAKRLGEKKSHSLAKTNFLQKLKKSKLHNFFKFSKITGAIRLGANKPKFRFWNKNAFYFAKTLPFTSNAANTYKIKRFRLNAILRKRIKTAKREDWERAREAAIEKWKAANWRKNKNKYPRKQKRFQKTQKAGHISGQIAQKPKNPSQTFINKFKIKKTWQKKK